MYVPRESVARIVRASLSRNGMSNTQIKNYPGEFTKGTFSYNTRKAKGQEAAL